MLENKIKRPCIYGAVMGRFEVFYTPIIHYER